MIQGLRQQAAEAALSFIEDDMVIGVGTGSTTNYFIDALASIKHRIEGCVASSEGTAQRLKALGIPVLDCNAVRELSLYIDSADEINQRGEMIKGGGGALTREKIVASIASQFVCIVDAAKLVLNLGAFPVAVEVLPMARSYVARELVKLGGDPAYREGFITDNGNVILDVHNFKILTPVELEAAIELIPGVVECGIFAKRRADTMVLASADGVHISRF